ncbi:MAG: MurT ligase domain-containing protein [Actinomycetes bacterium]
MRVRLAVIVGTAVSLLLRIAGRAGTTLPGRVVLALAPKAIATLGAKLGAGTAVVSATNGKTTTSALVEGALSRSGMDVVHNSAGANMSGGIVSALIGGSSGEKTIGLFEIDEFWVPEIASELRPKAVLLGNLFRDQLDRYGELDTILDRWVQCARVLTSQGTMVLLCADDPGMAWVGHDLPQEMVIWFGLEDTSVALDSLPASADAGACRSCGSPLNYSAVLLGHLGHWSCPGCGHSRPAPSYKCTKVHLKGARAIDLEIVDPDGLHSVSLGLPGVYNAYNALGAWALAAVLGVSPDVISASFKESGPSFGRAERFSYKDRSTSIMLVKNPTGANEVFRTLTAEPDGLNLLFVLNDRIADGRDVSWIWDADLEVLAHSVGNVVCSGTRAEEAALRFLYAGVGRDRITTVKEPIAALDQLAKDSAGDLWVLPTYTAMLELRGKLADLGTVERVV